MDEMTLAGSCTGCGEHRGARYPTPSGGELCWACFEGATEDAAPREESLYPAGGRSTGAKLRRYDVAAMLRQPPPPVPWVIEGVAARGHLSMLAGREKGGKSYLCSGFGVACAEGGGTVAGMACHPAKVLVVDAENGHAELHRRVRMLGLSNDNASKFEVFGAAGFDLARDLGELVDVVDDVQPDLVIADSFRSLWSGDENDASAVARALDPFRSVVHDRRTAAMLIHHANRGSGLYRGSSAIGASVEHLLLLMHALGDPDKRRRRLVNTGSRFAREADDRWLRIDADEKLGAVFIEETDPYGAGDGDERRAAPKADAIAPQVKATLNGQPMRLADVAAAVGRGPKDGTVRRVLTALEAAGEARRNSDGLWLGSPVPSATALKADGTVAPGTSCPQSAIFDYDDGE